jgi:Leucine-rich repeat (LRR) protein
MKVTPLVVLGVVAAAVFAGTAFGDEEEAAEAIRKAKGYTHKAVTGPDAGKYTVVKCFKTTDVDAVMQQVKHLKSLHVVGLTRIEADKYMDILAAIPELRTLDLALTTDAGMKTLGTMKKLETSTLTAPGLSDEAWSNLPNLTELKKLSVGGSAGDERLKHIAKLAKLEELDMNGKKVTDAGMKHLAGLKQLRGLILGSTAVGDKGLEDLAGLKELQKLFLYETPVTDDGCKVIAGFTHLTWLRLDGTKFTDAGVTHLLKLDELEELDLSRTQLTDGGLLEFVGGCKKLKQLRVAQTQVTKNAPMEFRKQRVGVRIMMQ